MFNPSTRHAYDELELTEPRLDSEERLAVLPPCERLRAELVAFSS